MPTYFVQIPIQTRVEIAIEADSGQEAVEIAESKLIDPEADRSEWEIIRRYRQIGLSQIVPLWNKDEDERVDDL